MTNRSRRRPCRRTHPAHNPLAPPANFAPVPEGLLQGLSERTAGLAARAVSHRLPIRSGGPGHRGIAPSAEELAAAGFTDDRRRFLKAVEEPPDPGENCRGGGGDSGLERQAVLGLPDGRRCGGFGRSLLVRHVDGRCQLENQRIFSLELASQLFDPLQLLIDCVDRRLLGSRFVRRRTRAWPQLSLGLGLRLARRAASAASTYDGCSREAGSARSK